MVRIDVQAQPHKDVPADNVAVINAADLSPILENTQVKEIREIVSAELTDTKSSRPLEINIKVAELPTTTPIEVCAQDV